MKEILGMLLFGLLIAGGPVAQARATTEKAICAVCRVTRGEREAEPVKAVRTHGGEEYRFCSTKCAEAFDADPVAYELPTFPRPAPSFAITDLAGSQLSKGGLEGKVVLVDFWATWCAPCLKAMPKLQALHAKYAGRGFAVIGISIDEDEGAVKKVVTSKKITYPVALDSKASPAWDAFRVKAVPSAYLLDRDGRIVAQWTGAAADPHEIEARLVGHLGEN